MWIRPGRQVTVTLRDGSAISGTTRMSWSLRTLRVGAAGTLGGDSVRIDGTVLVPVTSILVVQVKGKASTHGDVRE